MSGDLYCLNVTIAIKPERREEFLEVAANNARGTLTSEPLAVTYTWGEDKDTPNTFHFHEAYKGEEGFKAHAQAPHFKKWEEFAGTDPLSAPPQVSFFWAKPAPQ